MNAVIAKQFLHHRFGCIFFQFTTPDFRVLRGMDVRVGSLRMLIVY